MFIGITLGTREYRISTKYALLFNLLPIQVIYSELLIHNRRLIEFHLFSWNLLKFCWTNILLLLILFHGIEQKHNHACLNYIDASINEKFFFHHHLYLLLVRACIIYARDEIDHWFRMCGCAIWKQKSKEYHLFYVAVIHEDMRVWSII